MEKPSNSNSTNLIQLNGCGYKTQWQMPSNQLNCPVKRCQRWSFVNHSALITHYKREHAEVSIYCCICEKPIVSSSRGKFVDHYKHIHPNVSDPFNFDANAKLPKLSQQNKMRKSHVEKESDDNLINLYAYGYHTQWNFPSNMKNCPVKKCNFSKFTTQADAKKHYQEHHSKSAILCSICQKPISAHPLANFITHYRRKHENVKNPFEFVGTANISDAKEKCDPVRRIHKRVKNSPKPTSHNKRGVQLKNRVPCGICNKSISNTSSAYLTRHYRLKHNIEKPPAKQSDTRKPKNFSISSKLQRRAISGMRGSQKRMHRPVKPRHSLNAKRVLISHSWVKRFCCRILEKCLQQTSQIIRTNNTVQNSETSDQQSLHNLENLEENDVVPNEKSFLMPVIINVSGGCSMEDTEMVQHSRLKRRFTDSNDVDHDIDEDGETSQAQQSKKQKLVHEVENPDSKQFQIIEADELQIQLSNDTIIELSPSPSTSHFMDSVTPKPESPNPTESNFEASQLMFDNEKPLDLTKPIEIMDSDDEAEIITIDSDNDYDDHKEHLHMMTIKNKYSMNKF